MFSVYTPLNLLVFTLYVIFNSIEKVLFCSGRNIMIYSQISVYLTESSDINMHSLRSAASEINGGGIK